VDLLVKQVLLVHRAKLVRRVLRALQDHRVQQELEVLLG
jgi:hypothetical protein